MRTTTLDVLLTLSFLIGDVGDYGGGLCVPIRFTGLKVSCSHAALKG